MFVIFEFADNRHKARNIGKIFVYGSKSYIGNRVNFLQLSKHKFAYFL